MTRRLQPTPFKAAKNFRRSSALYFSCALPPPCLVEARWMVATNANLNSLIGPCFGASFGSSFGPRFLGATIRIERTGAKTEAKTGPKSGPKSGTNFAKLFAHFFGHAANRCPQWSCPSFATFAFFLFARILARILRQPIQAKLAATGKRTRASVSKPNLCPQQ